jgi:hypothetical protein
MTRHKGGQPALPKVYVALGFSESRLEIALLRQTKPGKRYLTLRSAPLPQGVVCPESGELTRPADIQTHIGNLTCAIQEMDSVELLLGIPDNLCRTRTVSVTTNSISTQLASALERTSYERGRVVDIFPGKSQINQNQEALMVSCSLNDIKRYISALVQDTWIVGIVTPLMVCRYNYLINRSPTSLRERLLIVHACQNACDIALWSANTLLYREHVTASHECDAWESTCLRRVLEVSARIAGGYMGMIRGPRRLVSMIESGLSAQKILFDCEAIDSRLADSVDGEVESLDIGGFDTALGLLAQVARERGTHSD